MASHSHCTFTDTSPDLCELLVEILPYASVQTMPLPVEPFKQHPMSMSYIYKVCLSTFSGCGWAYGLTFTLKPPQMLSQICESWLKFYLMQVCKPCHYALVEAVEPFKLHPITISYIYKVFEHLLRLWMGIWLQTHTVTTTDASPDLGKLAEILPDASKCANHATRHWLRL